MADRATEAGRRRAWLLGSVAALLGGLVYLNALHGPFVYDDHLMIVDNTSLRDLGRPGPLLLQHRFRPLVNLSYAIDYAGWGLSPVGYHLTSIVLHLINVGLVFRLTTGLVAAARGPDSPSATGPAEGGGIAFTTAALFAVHPMLTEAVSYVSGRAEVLCGTFFLLAFLAFQRVLIAPSALAATVAMIALGLALAAKEVAVVLPLVVLAYDHLFLGGERSDRRHRLRCLHLPLIGLAAVLALTRLLTFLWIEPEPPPVPWWQYLLIEVVVVWRYIGLLLLPLAQSIVHSVREIATPAEPVVLLAGAGLIALGAMAWRVRRTAPLVSFGLAWFLLLLLPSSSVIPLNQAMAEHRVYLASIGLFLAATQMTSSGLAWLRARRAIGGQVVPRTVSIAVVAVLSLATVGRNLLWADPALLWQEATLRAPDTWVSHYGLGETLRMRGWCAAAIPAYERALALRPGETRVSAHLGACLTETGQLDAATRVLQSALGAEPASVRIHTNLGVVALLRGQPDQARRHFEAAAAADPRHVQSRRNLAALNESVYGNPGEALRLCQEIERLAPGTPGVSDCIHRNAARLGSPARLPAGSPP